ncbi:PPOX class probable F420-dependent enzyme [Motilibacter rhizosphaerae]|uniref:PPOX class probable F420-dependent enzyme n=1 Tax=Motilibacter rhizosphaerae TaxID=598652 RepID=A0A4Q7NW00_9ACTN|nr:PPOX class F420-dependent oxidoreductase [Motilibacter rhizosphaerae]RZS91456.1 PPOX class probable F420-dependent enzyme [Motilibacter rhizosphaerae]
MATATTTTVDRAALLEFLRPRRKGVLATTRADGRPQLSPVACGVDDAGLLLVSTYPERAKARNAARDPRVSVCVLSDDWDGPWVQLDGSAEVITLPEAVEPLVDYYRALAGEHPDWEEYRAAMVRQGKCLLRITVERWSPIATGGFPARLSQ